MRKALAPMLAMVIVLCTLMATVLTVPACDPHTRQSAIKTTFVALNAANDGFTTWQQARQADIVTLSTSREEAVNKIAEFRIKRDRINDRFIIVYRALLFAATQNDDPSLERAIDDARKLIEEVEALKKGNL